MEELLQRRTYYFCAKGCKTAFDREPEKYLEQPGTDSMQHGSGGMGHGR